jgi:hypothetical protein
MACHCFRLDWQGSDALSRREPAGRAEVPMTFQRAQSSSRGGSTALDACGKGHHFPYEKLAYFN